MLDCREVVKYTELWFYMLLLKGYCLGKDRKYIVILNKNSCMTLPDDFIIVLHIQDHLLSAICMLSTVQVKG